MYLILRIWCVTGRYSNVYIQFLQFGESRGSIRLSLQFEESLGSITLCEHRYLLIRSGVPVLEHPHVLGFGKLIGLLDDVCRLLVEIIHLRYFWGFALVPGLQYLEQILVEPPLVVVGPPTHGEQVIQ